ncbi:putative defense protein 3 [Stegodyphus dumicola]|uniref:putative defense protein 3 n=1 Tax=Stegodyphus dumicola TaxID=202533 RepID=UPI0015AD440C|nr:putative defense protein 3 [Stegodyphus dumicola]
MSSAWLFIVAITSGIIALSFSYPEGAPKETCATFRPNHDNHTPKTSPHNYELSANPSSVQQGSTTKVTLQGKGGETFKGFFIQGQDEVTKRPVGKFRRQGDANTVDCSGTATSITHVNPKDKSSVSVVWEAPASYTGKVIFRAAVVKTFENFWDNIYSQPIVIN